MRHVAGSQFRNHVQATLQCDHCVTVDNNLRIAKDNLRSAKLLLARANEEIAALRRAKNLDAATNLITVRDELLANQAVLLKRCDDFEVEVAQSKKKHGSDAALIEYLRKQVADLQEASRARHEDAWKDHEISRLKEAIEDMRRQKEALSGEKEELLVVVQKLQEGVNSYRTQLQQSEMRRKTESRRSFENTSQASVTGDELLRVKEELYMKANECAEMSLTITRLSSEVVTMGSIVSELQSSKRVLLDDKSDLQQKVRFASKDAEYARKKADEAERLVNEAEGRCGELESAVHAMGEDNRRLEKEAAALRDEQARLRASNTSLMARLAKESEIVRQVGRTRHPAHCCLYLIHCFLYPVSCILYLIHCSLYPGILYLYIVFWALRYLGVYFPHSSYSACSCPISCQPGPHRTQISPTPSHHFYPTFYLPLRPSTLDPGPLTLDPLAPQTLESAISSSVRLCVVAPTVNVHLADTKLKMQSALPENSIRDFVVNEVLAKYTFIFKQVRWGRWLVVVCCCCLLLGCSRVVNEVLANYTFIFKQVQWGWG
jgi:hypothetical protein